jgi:hypothetical protein
MYRVERWDVMTGGWATVGSYPTLAAAYAAMLALPLAHVLMSHQQVRVAQERGPGGPVPYRDRGTGGPGDLRANKPGPLGS